MTVIVPNYLFEFLGSNAVRPSASTLEWQQMGRNTRRWLECSICFFALLIASAWLGGCSGGGGGETPAENESEAETESGSGGSGAAFTPGRSWQIQLSGDIDLGVDAEVFDIDLVDVPEAIFSALKQRGVKIICYFSAGTFENWRTDAGKFPAEILGKPLDDFPDERWLDIRRIELLAPILESRLDRAAGRGCDAVDPDNVDGYSNDTGFPISASDQLAFNRWIAAAAKKRGLAVGLKNDIDQIPDLVSDYDFAVNEQCFEYDECEKLLPFISAGKAVFGIEYNLTPDKFCRQANSYNFDTLKKEADLGPQRISCR